MAVILNVQHILMTDILSISNEIALQWIPQYFTDDKSTLIGSGNGLVPSGNKLLPEPMFTKFYVTIWRHSGANDLRSCLERTDIYGMDK